MVAVAAFEHFHIGVDPRPIAERAQKFFDEFGIKVPAFAVRKLRAVIGKIAPAAEIDCHQRRSLIHGHHAVGKPFDSLAGAERFAEGLAEHDRNVLRRMVGVHFRVAVTDDGQIDARMHLEELQHVVEKPDAAVHAARAVSVQIEREENFRLRRLSLDFRCPLCHTLPPFAGGRRP